MDMKEVLCLRVCGTYILEDTIDSRSHTPIHPPGAPRRISPGLRQPAPPGQIPRSSPSTFNLSASRKSPGKRARLGQGESEASMKNRGDNTLMTRGGQHYAHYSLISTFSSPRLPHQGLDHAMVHCHPTPSFLQARLPSAIRMTPLSGREHRWSWVAGRSGSIATESE